MKITSLEDEEIYEIATNVLHSITQDLANGIYAELGGTLELAWSAKPIASAWAESDGNPDSAPKRGRMR